jgi:hypothetical protein
LWIMVVRSPCDWAEGMFRKPYHMCPPKHPERCGPESDPNEKVWMNQNTVAGMTLLHFFTELEWKDWAESVPFLREDDKKMKGRNEDSNQISISKPSANYTYPSVFALRRHKLAIMKQIIETVPRNVKFVRLKELERSPEMFIQSLVKEFNVTVKDGYAAQPPSPVNHPTVCFTPDEWDAAQNGIDWMMEAEFGFNPSDCRMCYGYEKSTRLYTRVMEGKKTKKLLANTGGVEAGKSVKYGAKRQRGNDDAGRSIVNSDADANGSEADNKQRKQTSAGQRRGVAKEGRDGKRLKQDGGPLKDDKVVNKKAKAAKRV